MSDNANRGSRRNRRQRLNQEAEAEQAGGGEGATEASQADAPQVPDAALSFSGIDVITRLRDRVETAALELKRLREENTALAARLQAMETQPAAASALSLDQDPEVLRRKITGFIDAIDRYLEQENTQG